MKPALLVFAQARPVSSGPNPEFARFTLTPARVARIEAGAAKCAGSRQRLVIPGGIEGWGAFGSAVDPTPFEREHSVRNPRTIIDAIGLRFIADADGADCGLETLLIPHYEIRAWLHRDVNAIFHAPDCPEFERDTLAACGRLWLPGIQSTGASERRAA